MVSRDDSVTSAVNILPIAAHITPAVSAPMSAGFQCTRVFGTNMYIIMKIAVTITYGVQAASNCAVSLLQERHLGDGGLQGFAPVACESRESRPAGSAR